jgi:predicted nucleic acid-binding protein
MRVLIDTNVAITYISGRNDPFSSEIEQIMRLCAEEKIEGVLAFHSLSIIWYISRKAPDEERRKWIRKLCTLLTVSGADNQLILDAIDKTDFRDFEDALQDCCAIESDAEYIITVNKRDFADHSTVTPVTPKEFLLLLDHAEN